MDSRTNGRRYLKTLKERAQESRVYRKHQLDGLEIAQMLRDERHKALYIKLAKEHGGERLRLLAREVAERPNVKNRGAYFMTLLGRVRNGLPVSRRRKQLT